MKTKILEIIGLAIDLKKKGVDVNCSYLAHCNMLDIRVFAIGWTACKNPTISRLINLSLDDAMLELNVIAEYLNQFLQKVSE